LQCSLSCSILAAMCFRPVNPALPKCACCPLPRPRVSA
jgi:hypothetical protein